MNKVNERPLVVSMGLLMIAALTAVACSGWVFSSQGAERWVALGGLAIGLAWLGLCWPKHPRRWLPALFFLMGCFLGSWLLLHSLAQRESNKLDAIAIESLVFESSLAPLLTTNQCQAAQALLDADLEILPLRPALALVVRSDLWNEAAGRGCITSSELAKARTAIRTQMETGPLGAMGVQREDLLARVGTPAELETVGAND